MRVTVAGSRGYVGAVLVPMLQAAGHRVTEIDMGYYEGCDFGGGLREALERPVDIRSVAAHDLRGADAVVCLAALSNDPLGSLNAALTQSINLHGTLRLARVAKYAGVPRFVFFSSCSLYGAANSEAVAEDAPMQPVTPYGESKALAEQGLARLADESFSPTFLRHATAYGPSPRLRLDVVVNNLAASAVTTGTVRLESDGSPWRPLVHVSDMARTCLAVLEAPRELVHDEAFNVGRDEDNLQVREIAERVREEFLLFRAGQPGRAAVVVGVGLGHSIPQTRLADPQILGKLGQRRVAGAGQLDSTLPKLRRVWRGHQNILPGGRVHLRAGVRTTRGKLRGRSRRPPQPRSRTRRLRVVDRGVSHPRTTATRGRSPPRPPNALGRPDPPIAITLRLLTTSLTWVQRAAHRIRGRRGTAREPSP